MNQDLPERKQLIDKFCEDLKNKLPYVKITQVQEKGKITKILVEGTVLISELK